MGGGWPGGGGLGISCSFGGGAAVLAWPKQVVEISEITAAIASVLCIFLSLCLALVPLSFGRETLSSLSSIEARTFGDRPMNGSCECAALISPSNTEKAGENSRTHLTLDGRVPMT